MNMCIMDGFGAMLQALACITIQHAHFPSFRGNVDCPGADAAMLSLLLQLCSGLVAAAVAVTAALLLLTCGATLMSLLPSAVLISEVLFAFWFRHHRAAFENWRPEVPDHDKMAAFARFVVAGREMKGFMTLESVLRRWFGDVPISEIKSENLAELMSYGFLYKRRWVQQLLQLPKPCIRQQDFSTFRIRQYNFCMHQVA